MNVPTRHYFFGATTTPGPAYRCYRITTPPPSTKSASPFITLKYRKMDDLDHSILERFKGPIPAKSASGVAKVTHRASTPRTEKGTTKVDDHEVRQEAAVLLYALARGIGATDMDIKDEMAEQFNKRIEKVVANFGLDKERVRSEGEAMYSSIVQDVQDDQVLADIESEYKAFGAKLDAMKKNRTNVQGEDLKDLVSGIGSGDDTRKTRGGHKRVRAIEEADERLEKMRAKLKKLKREEEAGRRQRS